MSALQKDNADYAEVTVIRVSWGKFRKKPITKELAIRRRSTLVMFNSNGEEVGRLIAQTKKKVIEELFKAALALG